MSSVITFAHLAIRKDLKVQFRKDKTTIQSVSGREVEDDAVIAAADLAFDFARLEAFAPNGDLTASNAVAALSGKYFVGGTNRVQFQDLYAVVSDGDALDAGATFHKLADSGYGSRLSGNQIIEGYGGDEIGRVGQQADPVSIWAHGRISKGSVGSLQMLQLVGQGLGFNRETGFGVDNGPGSGNRWINRGDAVNFELNPAQGRAQVFERVSFTIDTDRPVARIALDIDGDVLRSGFYGARANAANRDFLALIEARNGDVVVIDFLARTITVGGAVAPQTEAFFAAYGASAARNLLTIGAVDGARFSIMPDLAIVRRDAIDADNDTNPPSAPTLALDPASDSGAQGDGITAALRPAFVGTAEPGAVVRVLRDGVEVAAATTGADGTWTAVPPADLPQGSALYAAAATDAAGNVSPASTALPLSIDATPPSAPMLALDPASDSGAQGDGITAALRPAFVGTAEPGAVVRVLRDGVEVAAATAGADGTWTAVPPADLPQGSALYAATATDAAGNVSPASDPFPLSIALDGGPGALTVAFRLTDSDEASAPGDDTTATGRVALVGETAPGAIVTLTLGALSRTTPADTAGRFRFDDVPLAQGSNAVSVGAALDGATATAAREIERTVSAPVENLVIGWIREATQSIADESAAPTFASRALAMTSLAMHDALAAAEGGRGVLATPGAAPGSDAEAAIAQAAHDVLLALFPGQEADFAARLAASLAAIPDGAAQDAGVALGRAIAREIIDRREGDGWNAVVVEAGRNAPGAWAPTAPMFAPGLDAQWATLTPFAMASPDQFRPGPPPTLDSAAFIDAYEQVRMLGAADSATRTPEQTEIARFWAAASGTPTPAGLWNEIAAVAALEESMGLAGAARLFAQLNMALADAAIVSWDAKYEYDHWRPITAIRQGGDIGLTEDRDWTPFISTPPFPEYTSGHSSYSGAAATVLGGIFGDGFAFSLTSAGFTRNFESFSEAAAEAGMSRIFGGIHYSFSNTAGLSSGAQVGQWVLDYFDGATDSAPPTIRLDIAFAPVGQDWPTLAGVVADNLSGVRSLALVTDGGIVDVAFDAQGRFAIDLDGVLSGAGARILALVAEDAAGNVGRLSDVRVARVAEAPQIALAPESLQPGETIGADERLTGRVALGEGDQLVALSYSIDGGPGLRLGFDAQTGAFDAPLDLRMVAPGARTVAIEAQVASGFVSTQSVEVTVGALPFTITRVGPEPNVGAVGVTFRPVIEFSRPVDPATLTPDAFFATGPDGATLPARIAPLADGLGAWLLFDGPMPGASSIALRVGETRIRAADGAALDPGENFENGFLRFSTVSTASAPGTTITGVVLDPGADRELMTADDVVAGPNGLSDFENNTYLKPLAGVKVFVLGREGDFVLTDAQGRFTLEDTPAGNVKLAIDGRTATNAPDGLFFPEMVMDLTIRAGVENTVMGSMGPREAQAFNATNPAVYLPRLDEAMLTPLSENEPTIIRATGAQNTKLTRDQLDLVQLKVAPGALVDESGDPVASPVIGVGSVPPSMVLDMLPPGVLQHSFDITIQAPGGAVFTTPAALTLPNIFGLAPGEKAAVMSFDHTTGRLVINGSATVSADGLSLTTDPDSGILAPGWHGVAPGSRGRGAILQNCDPAAHSNPDRATYDDLNKAIGAGNDLYGLANSATGGKVVKLAGPVANVASGVVQLESRGLNFRDHVAELVAADATGQAPASDGGGPADLTYKAIKLAQITGDVAATAVDAFAYIVGNLPFFEGTALGRAADILPATVSVAEASTNYLVDGKTPIGPIIDYRNKLTAEYAAATSSAKWSLPANPQGPDALGLLDQTIQQAIIRDTQRSEFLTAFVRDLRSFDEGFQQLDPDAPNLGQDSLRDALDILEAMADALDGAIDAARAAAEFGRAADDAADIAGALQDAIDAFTLDFGAAIPAFGDAAGATVIVDGFVVEYGPVFYAVLVNLDTGVEQRFQFDPRAGIDQFLSANTRYKLTVFDPVTRDVGEVFFESGGNGSSTAIPPVLMMIDAAEGGANGFTTTGSYVLGLNPARADNLVPGITDAEAISSGAFANTAIVEQTGQVAALDLPGEAKALALGTSGANAGALTAYVATGSDGLAIVDLANPRAPVLRATLDLPGDAQGIAYDAAARMVAVATGDGISFVDVSRPEAPQTIGRTNAVVTAIEAAGGRLYAVANGALAAFDAATGEVVAFAAGLPALDLVAEGGRLYALTQQAEAYGLLVFDIAGEVPIELGRFTLPDLSGGAGVALAPAGRIAVENGIVLVGGAFSALNGGYATVDARDPSAMTVASFVDDNGLGARLIAPTGTGLALGSGLPSVGGRTGLFLDLFDTGDAGVTDDLVRSVSLPGTTTPTDLALVGQLALLTDGAQLRVAQFAPLDRLGVAPTAAITTPPADADPAALGLQLFAGARIDLGIAVDDDQLLRSVELLVNGRSVATDLGAPFQLGATLPRLAALPSGAVTLQVRATDTGGNVGLSAPVTATLIADLTPFALISATPVDGAAAAAGAARKVTLVFSKPVDPATLSSEAVTLTGPDGAAVRPTVIVLRPGGTTVDLSYPPLAIGAHALSIDAAAIRDLGGAALGAGTIASGFTVAAFDTVWEGLPVGFWSGAANWSGGALPSAAQSVLVPIAAGGEIVYDAPLVAGDWPLLGAVLIGGAGRLRIGEDDTGQSRTLRASGFTQDGETVIAARGSLDVFDGDLTVEGRLEMRASTVAGAPFGFPLGASARIGLRGEEVVLSGGGVIEMLSDGVQRPEIFGQSRGFEPFGGGFDIAVASRIVNEDLTIRGGGSVRGNMVLVNGPDGGFESTLDQRLILEASLFIIGNNSSQTQRSSIENHGVLRANSNSTLQINGSNVLNADGRIEAVGAGALVLLTGTTVIAGGEVVAAAPGAQGLGQRAVVIFDNASLVDGAVLDLSDGGAGFVNGFAGLIDATVLGDLQVGPQTNLGSLPFYGLSLGGMLRAEGEISVFRPNATVPVSETTVEVFRDLTFTGGGTLTLFDDVPGGVRLRTAAVDYPVRNSDAEPAPDAPAPIRIVNVDGAFRWAGLIEGGSGIGETFFDIDIDDDGFIDETVVRPERYGLEIENRANGLIENWLNTGDAFALTFAGSETYDGDLDRFQIVNSGLIRATNLAPLAFAAALISNASSGRVEAASGPVRLAATEIAGGTLSASGGSIEVAAWNGWAESLLYGVAVEIGAGETLTVGPGVRLGLLPAFTGASAPQTTVALGGALRVLAADGVDSDDATLEIGRSGAPATLSLDGAGAGWIELTGDGVGTARIVGEGQLTLRDLTVTGDGEIGDGLDIVVAGVAPVVFETEGALIVRGAFDERLDVETFANLELRGAGEIRFEKFMFSDGRLTVAEGSGGLVRFDQFFHGFQGKALFGDRDVTFESALQNFGLIEASGSVAFNGSVVNDGEMLFAGATVAASPATVENSGVLGFSDDAQAVFDGALVFTEKTFGLIPELRVESGASAELRGAVSGLGGIDIGDALVFTEAEVGSGIGITMSGGAATLRIGDLASFDGQVFFFGADDRIIIDEIDIATASLTLADDGENLRVTVEDDDTGAKELFFAGLNGVTLVLEDNSGFGSGLVFA